MEEFWNTVHFFAYKFLTKLYRILIKIDPILNVVYKTDFAKKHFEKMGKDPIKEVSFALTDKRVGQSSFFAAGIMYTLPIVFCFALQFYYIAFVSKPNSLEDFLVVLLLYSIPSVLLNYFLLFHKDKYVKYFKKFEKQPRKWKIKWAWISVWVILFPFLVLIGSFIVI